jgi:hypothetical protein
LRRTRFAFLIKPALDDPLWGLARATQIDVSVNAPQAGKIVKLLANEEDTVTVGQDLFVLEPGDFGGEGTSYS